MKGTILYASNLKEQAKNARLLYEVALLRQEGYKVDVLFKPKDEWSSHLKTLSSFKIFNHTQIKKISSISHEYDYIVLFGLAVLPAVKRIDSAKNRVIYQTMNRDVSYFIYELGLRVSLIRFFSHWLQLRYSLLEKYYASLCKAIVVNSDALLDILPQAKVNYYTSPFESIPLIPFSKKEFAFVYIGQLRKEKGVEEMIQLIEKSNLTLHFFGDAKDREAQNLTGRTQVKSYGNLSLVDLKNSLSALMKKFNLIGISLILPVHESYATQEANKEIDYLSLGIPFIGNQRETTRQKIEYGCGVFKKDFERLLNLDFYIQCRMKCLAYYRKRYNNQRFRDRLTGLFQ